MDGLTEFSYDDLRSATMEFSAILDIGNGRRQWWYRACIPGHGLATVKRFRDVGRNTLNMVVEEVKVHRSLRGRESPFIAKMLGYCIFKKDPMLVYEYVPPGDCTLRECLQHGKLRWTTRLKIALNIASAIQTLHGADDSHAPFSVYMRDLQARDILLDHSRTTTNNNRAAAPEPKLVDFSDALVVPNKSNKNIHIRPSFASGPRVYTDPFYIKTGHLTDKTDVYSFGVLLIELLTGMNACDALPPSSLGSSKTLVSLVTETSKLGGRLYEYQIVDPCLECSAPCRASISEAACLATKCCAYNPHKRPSISAIHRVLLNILTFYFQFTLPIPKTMVDDKRSSIVTHRSAKGIRRRRCSTESALLPSSIGNRGIEALSRSLTRGPRRSRAASFLQTDRGYLHTFTGM